MIFCKIIGIDQFKTIEINNKTNEIAIFREFCLYISRNNPNIFFTLFVFEESSSTTKLPQSLVACIGIAILTFPLPNQD